MSIKKYQSNKQLQVVLNNINLSILFAKKPYMRKSPSNIKQGIFGFCCDDVFVISKAISHGVNIASKLEKYIVVEGVAFLQNINSKQKFIEEITI